MTSQNFTLSGGTTASVDVENGVTMTSGKTVGGVLQYEWDHVVGGVTYFTTDAHVIIFIPGATTSNGVWKDHAGNFGTRSNGLITMNVAGGPSKTWTETDAFVSGIIPTTGEESDDDSVNDNNSSTIKKVFCNFW